MTWKINEDLKLSKTSNEFKKTPVPVNPTQKPQAPAESKATLVRSASTSSPKPTPVTNNQYKYTAANAKSSNSSSIIDANLVNAAKRVAALQALKKK